MTCFRAEHYIFIFHKNKTYDQNKLIKFVALPTSINTNFKCVCLLKAAAKDFFDEFKSFTFLRIWMDTSIQIHILNTIDSL